MTKEARLLKKAEAIAAKVESWADLSNALYDPYTGLLTAAFPKKAQRVEFMKTAEFKKIHQLSHDAKVKFGLAEGATPKPSGKLVIRIPKSLHQSLRDEALTEAVSLNQLIVYKLSAHSNLRGKSVKHIA